MDFQEALNCAFAEAGVHIGEMLRCMLEQELASHFSRITQINSILQGDTCEITQSVVQATDTTGA